MAKARDRQQRMEGTFDKPIKVVVKKAEAYSAALRQRMSTQQAENVLREELIELMQTHNVQTCDLDGEVVTLEHIEKDRIKVSAKETMDEG